jgi:hypothetical protein
VKGNRSFVGLEEQQMVFEIVVDAAVAGVDS